MSAARPTKAELEARIAELEMRLEFATAHNDGVEVGVRAELALMPDAVKAAPALAASAISLARIIDGVGADDRVRLDLAPAPMHAELRNTLAALRAYHTVAAKDESAADRLAAQREKRRQDAARRATAATP